jgi:hypothetical protein
MLAQAHPDQAESALTEADAQIRAIEAQRAAVVRGVTTFALVFVPTIVALVVAGLLASARGQTLTCEASGAYRHCFDHHGYSLHRGTARRLCLRPRQSRRGVDHMAA